jgi:hypothetical protein
MASNQPSRNFTLGFLTVLEVDGFGTCGGLLVVNPIGRPIEFHCTAPISVNRTQEILYGKSLQSYLYCDQIGETLIEKAKSKVDLIITDNDSLVDLEVQPDQSLVLLVDKSEIDESPAKLFNATKIKFRSNSAFHAYAFRSNPEQTEIAAAYLNQFNETLPLDEPFERIEQAIDEAQAVAR